MGEAFDRIACKGVHGRQRDALHRITGLQMADGQRELE